MKGGQAQPLAVLAGAAMAVGVFLPWGRLTITLLEVPVSLEFKGTQIGSDIGDIPWGWFMLGAGVLVIIGAFSRGTRLLRVASTGGVVFAVVNALTLHSSTPHASVSIGGETPISRRRAPASRQRRVGVDRRADRLRGRRSLRADDQARPTRRGRVGF